MEGLGFRVWGLGTPDSWNMGLEGLVLGSPILYFKGIGIRIFWFLLHLDPKKPTFLAGGPCYDFLFYVHKMLGHVRL